MKKKTLAALKKSIKHWEENLAAKTYDKTSISPKDCALCCMFLEKNCKGCPVAEKTGETCCDGSPYEGVYELHNIWRFASLYGRDAILAARAKFRQIAQKEIDFLKSLLPESEQEKV